jgi:hypothetical protein
MNTILQAIGSSVSDDPTLAGNTGIAKPIDVFCLQEANASATTGVAFRNLLNSLYPGSNYQSGTLDGGSTGSGTQVIIYNANALNLVSQVTVGTFSTAGQPRQAIRSELRPVGYSSAADIYIYNSHYKSDTGTTNVARRNDEALAIRADADALGAGKNIIYLGDLNVYKDSESMYQTLLGPGNGQAFDPIHDPGSWDNSATFSNVHTQSPFDAATATSLHTGFSGTAGGMDSRFDQQLISASVNSGHGVAYIPNSYQCFGNNGTHGLNNPIDSANNTAQPTNVLQALAGVLDHLPVVADYQLPASMSVALGSVPSQVIVGASVPVTVSVTNAAPVQYAIGADGLNYNVTSSGSLSGNSTATNLRALSGANTSTLVVNTASLGVVSGSISVNATGAGSLQVANGTFSQAVSTTVLAHSHPSFSSSTGQASLTIDFGTRSYNSSALGFGTASASFSVSNLADASGFSSKLDLDSIVGAGSTSALVTNLATFLNLSAAGSRSFSATMNTTVFGTFSATYTLNLSDENLLGAQGAAPLMLTLTGRVSLAGDANSDGVVNLLDLNALASNFGQSSQSFADGDFSGDGIVNIADFNALAQNFGSTYSAAPALGAIMPEPILTIPMIALIVISRRPKNSI